jgi:hypothetical protein
LRGDDGADGMQFDILGVHVYGNAGVGGELLDDER